ncbi:hypothetical protein JM18_008559, partial [Phytophthora kernoviae]
MRATVAELSPNLLTQSEELADLILNTRTEEAVLSMVSQEYESMLEPEANRTRTE